MEESQLEIRHAIPTGLQILLSDLDFLSQIKRNTKPCFSERVLVDSTSWSGALYRFCKGENKTNVISKIEQIVNQTVDAIEAHKNTDHIKIIINYFSNAREGISSLLTVYDDFPDTKARINVVIDIIDLQLDRFRSLIKGYRNEEGVKKNIEIELEKEEFPGLNTDDSSVVNLFDSSTDSEKRKTRRAKIKKSLDKQE